MDEIAQRYAELAHGIEGHNPGYIDGYYGPSAWRPTVPRPLAALSGDAEALAASVAALPTGARRTFLTAQLRAMQVSLRLLQGEAIPYAEEVRGLYDVEPPRAAEAEFDEAIALLEALLPGSGPIAEREQRFRRRFELPRERLPALMAHILAELRARTLARFGLPEGERFEVQLVSEQPWAAYNWYLGALESRIDVNTDLPLRLPDLPDLMAHEGYPGHHTEHALKEQRLFREAGHAEHSILLINAPECVTSEGIASRARRLVMSDDVAEAWVADELRELAALDVSRDELAAMAAIAQAKRGLRGVTGNAALLLHEEGASEAEVIGYLQRYRLATEQEARKSLQFMTHPNFRSYLFTYTVGGELLDALFHARGSAEQWFARLLTEPVTPGTIREWIGQSDGGAPRRG